MIRVSASSYPIINEIVGQFDRTDYPKIPPELVAWELNGSIEEKLNERIIVLPGVLQGKIYDLTPNISRWILSTGILRKEPKDNETLNAIEASAANRLKSLNVARIPYISSSERLIQLIFNSVIAGAFPEDKLRIRSAIIATSKKELIIEHCLRALIKIEMAVIKIGIIFAHIIMLVIPIIVFLGISIVGLLTLKASAISFIMIKIISWFLGCFTVLVGLPLLEALSKKIISITLYLWDSTKQLGKDKQAELDNRQIHKASELWGNLLFDRSYRGLS